MSRVEVSFDHHLLSKKNLSALLVVIMLVSIVTFGGSSVSAASAGSDVQGNASPQGSTSSTSYSYVTPGDVTSGDATSGDATSGDATSGDATSGNATSGNSTPANGGFNIDANGVLTNYTGPGGAVTIPSTAKSIGEYAFVLCYGLKSVTIPSSVTSIGNGAFFGCMSLTSVTIPSSVASIGEGTFYGCTSLTSVTIPSSVTSIGDGAFYGCTSLTSVTGASGVASVGSGAFYGTAWLKNQTGNLVILGHCLLQYTGSASTLTIPSGITVIGDNAFSSYYLKSVVIPSSVKSIGEYAFAYCWNLANVVIPSSVKSIGGNAFRGTPWLQNQTGGFLIINHVLIGYGGSSNNVVIPSGVTSIGNDAFENCWNLTSVTIPSSVTSIGDEAFEGSGLTSVTIPANVKTIGESGFTRCTALKSAVISSGVTSIGDDAFENCSQLTSISIPAGVKSIGSGMFEWCTALKSVAIPSSVTSIGEETFFYCTHLASISIPASVTSIGESAFSDCTALKNVIIPSGVTNVGDSAFEGSGLTSVTIPANVKTIGVSAFAYCTNLKNANILAGVSSLGKWAFYGCTNLTSVNIPATVKTIDRATFELCAKLTNVSIANGVSTIGDWVFHDCKSLTSVTIPSSVTSIGNYAFYNCTGLTSVTIPPNVTTIGDSAFGGDKNLTLKVTAGSYAETYVKKNKIKYISSPTTAVPLTVLETPANNAKLSGTVKVSGYVLNASGINRVDVSAVDSKGNSYSLGTVAGSGLTVRADIQKEFANKGYANIAKSGYSLPIDFTKLSSGTYTLKVAGVGVNGVVQYAATTVTINTAVPLTVLETPANNAKLSGTVKVSGYVLNASGINRVDVSAVDSKGNSYSLGTVAGSGLTVRADIQKEFANKGYANIAKSGYSLPIDFTKLSSGTYTLKVAGVGVNGVVQYAATTVTINTAVPLTVLETPANNAKLSGTVKVSGYVLNASGINRVDVSAVDSKGNSYSLGTVAGSGLTVRADIQKEFANKGYANIAKSGYSLPIDFTKLSSGTYTLKVAGVGVNGVVQYATTTILVK
ncbi:MAG: leucine-rich repeat domain-containing protein [Ethanoligenens sp.]